MKKNGTKNRNGSAEKIESPAEPFLSKGFVRWGAALLFSGWMFVLGILVGRESAPIHFDTKGLENELIALKKAVIQRDQEELKAKGKSLLNQQKNDLGFHVELKNLREDKSQTSVSETPKDTVPEKEIQSGTKEIEKSPLKIKKEAAAESAPTLPEKVPAKAKKEDKTEKSASAVKKVEKSETSLKISRRTETADTKQESETDKKFTLQIASFKNRSDAEVMVAELGQKGYSAYLSSVEVSDRGTHFRVMVGTLKSGTELESMKDRLLKDNYNPIILRSK